MTREQLFAVTALAAIVVITFGWWALALWPVPAEGAEWLVRTRAVCFGSVGSGLPAPEGWALLIGQPLGMTALLLIGWPRATRDAVRVVARSRAGRVLLTAAVLLLVAGAAGASVRVASAMEASRIPVDGPARSAAELPRLDRPAPALHLVDQRGDRFDLDDLRGRPVLVTFAFAHCETICPVLVREVRNARDSAAAREWRRGVGRGAAGGAAGPAVAVVTVDPWRDTPARLPTLARNWGLGDDEWLLSGEVDDVRAALEEWSVSITRDARTGEITHPAVVYIVDRAGRIAFVTTGGGDHAVALLERLELERPD